MGRGALLTLAWGSAQAGSSLALAATAWMVSGLTPSPLVNGALPALITLPALLPLTRRWRRPLAGTSLQLAAVLALLAAGSTAVKAAGAGGGPAGWPLLLSLVALMVFGLGTRMAALPLQRYLVGVQRLPMARLRRGSELGALLGHLLTAALFPIGRALLQFSQALVLLLPLLAIARGARRPTPDDAGEETDRQALPLSWRCGVQGLIFGALFGLLPLWVRQIEAGTCVDFALVLAAYGLGRSLGAGLPAAPLRAPFDAVAPRLARAGPYLGLALLLAATRWSPGWVALALFLPMGALAGASDSALVAGLAQLGDEPRRWLTLERSGALGGLVGGLAMGLIAQAFGLPVALPVQLGAFLGAAWLLGTGPPTLAVRPVP